MPNVVSFNQTILSNYQKIYPNLADFSYDIASDSLVFEGNTAKLNGYGLSRIDPIFFLMDPNDIFIFFKNGFYLDNKDSEQVEALFNQTILTEEHVNYLKKFADSFDERCNIYLKNKDFFDKNCETNESIRHYCEELINGRKVIIIAQKNSSANELSATSILKDAYEQKIMNGNAENKNSKGMSLTRIKPGFAGFVEDEYLASLKEKQKMGIAGFSSIILIISSAVVFGIYLALKMMP